jgi:hypothetical protein
MSSVLRVNAHLYFERTLDEVRQVFVPPVLDGVEEGEILAILKIL